MVFISIVAGKLYEHFSASAVFYWYEDEFTCWQDKKTQGEIDVIWLWRQQLEYEYIQLWPILELWSLIIS